MQLIPPYWREAEPKRIMGEARLPERLRGGVVAIGNFDGVHRGHQAVLGEALDAARQQGVPALVLTFEPHPRQFFRPEVPLPRISPAPMKARILATLGFDAVIEQEFTAAFAGRSADAFVRDVLRDRLGISHVVAGMDFHFGRNREGDPAFLVEAGERLGFRVTQVRPFLDESGQVVSSSRIREYLAGGDLSAANRLLGYRHSLQGEVIAGRQLGRKLGFPTANLRLHQDVALRHGIYAVRFRRPDGSLHDGVASFGRRPTIEHEGEPLLETFLFDFAGDLYGETCTVSMFAFLREELKFDDLDALTARMRQDEAEARAILSDAVPLSDLDRAIAFALPQA